MPSGFGSLVSPSTAAQARFAGPGQIQFAALGRRWWDVELNRRDRLGDILVKNGLITQAQLEEAVAGQNTQRDRRLGEILVDKAFIAREELHRYIKLQIEEAVYYLFTWNQGSFNFEADVAPDAGDFLVSINPESLLLEGARRVDEWSLIEKKIPSFDLVFEIDARIRADGEIVAEPSAGDYAALAKELDAAEVDAAAIMLLNAYRHPALERRVGEALRRHCPRVAFTESAAIWPEIREYERALLAALNAYVQPQMEAYFERLTRRLAGLGFRAPQRLPVVFG